jgi:site-specific DNA-methyltransferase (adenine-specific)
MIINKDCIEGMKDLEDNSIDCIITSPPYNKKGLLGKVSPGNQIWGKFNIDYNTYGDDMPEEEYRAWMIALLNECHRVIKPTGSIFFNHKPRRHKNRCYLPTDFISQSHVELYQLIIWDRRNSPNIRNDVLVPCTEHIYWFCKKKPKVFRDAVNPEYRGEVWIINPERQKQHPAPFPPQLVRNCIQLSTEEGDLVLDPFMGSGTTALVSQELNRKWIGFEIDEKYSHITKERVSTSVPPEQLAQHPSNPLLDAL